MKLSIITIVLNDKQNIEKTIESILSQDIELEYILIDGVSTDGTLDVIEKYKNKIDVLVSEKDSGIYNAMNKAVELASGEWLCFMNSGDVFYDSGVLGTIEKTLDNRFDVVYGDWEVRYACRAKKVKASKNIHHIWKGMLFSHQSCFVKKELLKKYKFNEKNPITSDFELFYKLYKNNKKFCYLPLMLASVSSGGISDVKRIESILSRYKFIDKNLKVHGYYGWLIVLEFMKSFLKKILRRGNK
jgi:glycosyltransferase involved in cell wall biosynthesis